jgi:hypothetical protein
MGPGDVMDKSKKNAVDDDVHAASSKVSDWVKKTLLTGVGAVFMTEEGIRNAMSDMKMPKNVIAAAVAQADKTKQDLSAMVANEVRNFLQKIKLEDIVQKALAGQTIEIKATIKFGKPNSKKKAVDKTAKSDEADD